MAENQIEFRQKEIVRVTLIGTVINAILIVLKFTAGILGNSAAMIADGVHSLSDFLTDFVLLIGQFLFLLSGHLLVWGFFFRLLDLL